jgi:hypothetical protein
MKVLTGVIVLFAVLVAASTVSAQTACNCSQTTLIGTQANIRFASFPSSTDWNGTVTTGVEFPSTNAAPWTWNPPGRFKIDLQASKVRIDIATGPATYGPGAQFKFTLNPLAPTPCGAASIVGSSVTTNRADAAPFVTSTSSFTGNSVTIAFANQGFFADWNKGDWIEAQLTFACQGGTTGTSPSTCCPPVDRLMVQGMFMHQGNTASTYLQPLDTTSAATTSFVTGLNAYLAYLHVVCPQTVKLKAEFFTGPVAAPVGIGPAGPLVGSDLTVPKSSVVFSALTVPALNTALNAGMNNFVHTNGVWYRIAVRITGINAIGQTVDCGFNAPECAIDDTFGFAYFAAGKMAAGRSYTN